MKSQSTRFGNVLGIAVGLAAMSAVAETQFVQTADFTSGTPIGWTVSNGEYRSPVFSYAVDRIEIRYSVTSGDTGFVQSGTDASASATLYATPCEGTESQIATFNAFSSGASLDFPETTDFRSFCIATENGLALSSFTVYVSATTLRAPANIVVSNNVTGTSFDVYWNSVEGATGYRVYVWTNDVASASAGMVVWQETFANAPATTSTSTSFRDSYTDSGTAGWYAETVYAYLQEGSVRVGNTKNKGVLVSPALPVFPEGSLTLGITAWRQTTGEGTDMPIGVVSGGVTNIVGVVALGDEAKSYRVAMPVLNSGDRIAIFSPTNMTSARVIVDDVAIIYGYSAGRPLYFVDRLDVGAVTGYSFAGLPSLPVQFAVEAYGRRGVTSAMTEAVEIDLSNPDKVPQLNACPLSSLAGTAHTYSQNFDSLSYVKSTSDAEDWKNGTTLPYWQAFRNGVAEDSISLYKGGNASGVKFLALATNEKDTVRALGARLNQSTTVEWGVVFTNDTDSVVCLMEVSYDAEQWGFANTTNQTLALSCLVTNRLEWIAGYADGWKDCTSTVTPFLKDDAHSTFESVEVDYVPESAICVGPGEVLALKWTFKPPTSGSSALMGIDDVNVKFQKKAKALSIHMR